MTNLLLIIILLPVEFATLVWALRRTGLLPFPHGTMIYLFSGQIILILHVNGILTYDFLRVYTTYAYIHFFPQMFTLQAVMFFALTSTLPKSRGVSFVDSLRSLHVNGNLFWVLAAVLYACWGVTFTALNWDVVWSNSTYLAMTDPEQALRVNNGITRTAFALQGPLSIVSAVALSFCLCTGRNRLALLLAPVVTWAFLFQLSAHSRAAAVYLILGGLLATLFPRGRIIALIVFALGFLTMLSVLWGRGGAHHGISSIPNYFTNIRLYYTVAGLDALSNIYEGVFTTSEYFSHNFTYNNTFKALAVLPSFSFIDGYDKIKDVYGIRLSYYVPNPAVSEVLSFGPIYAVWYFGVQLLAGRISARMMVQKPGLVSIGLNALVFLGSYLQFAYDTRTVFRLFFVVLVIGFILNRRGASLSPKVKPTPAPLH